MSTAIASQAQAAIDRISRIDWRHPPHDKKRVVAAYERRLAAAGLQRRVRCIDDPVETDAIDLQLGRSAKATKAWLSYLAQEAPVFFTAHFYRKENFPTDPQWDPWHSRAQAF